MGKHADHAPSQPSLADNRPALRRRDLAAALVAPLLIVLLLATYLIAPQFYLRWVLEPIQRERQIVELITTLCSLLGGLILLTVSVRLWRRGRGVRGGAMLIAVIGLAAIFLAGEESSWGQTYLGWQTPEAYKQVNLETNLHNTDLPIQSLGSVFLLMFFVALPIAWALAKDRLPRNWAPAIADWPVVVTIVVAFAWKEYKSVYRMIYDVETDPSPFYLGFIEQLNEQKEMLAAVALLMYAVYRIEYLRKTRAGRPANG